jgi:hypothetical protein
LTYGKQRGYEGSQYSEHQIFHQWFPDASKSDQEIAFCNNANAAIRKSLWDKNPYDETLTGLEDLAWAKWVKEQGYKIAYVADAEIVHVHNETPRGVYNRYRREAMAMRRIYPEANFNLYDFFRSSITNIFSDLWHALREGVLLKYFTSIFWFRIMQFHGTRMVHRETSIVTPHLRETFYYARERKKKDDRDRDVKPIRYGKELKVEWIFIGISHDNDKFNINGISLWAHEWKALPDYFAYVEDPSYGQDFKFQVYLIEDSGKKVEFAIGEFSSNVWGVYILK